MNTIEAIEGRRSVRRFKATPVSGEQIEKLLDATIRAPSAKNRQPWEFVVVQGDKRTEMVRIMRESIQRAKEAGWDTGSSEWSTNTMEQAPVTIFVFYPQSVDNTPEMDWSIVDIQSIGGAIQTMLLVAEDMGLGTLWICDVFYACDELRQWLGRADQMIAAVSVGYPDEAPAARPRKPWQEVTTWLG